MDTGSMCRDNAATHKISKIICAACMSRAVRASPTRSLSRLKTQLPSKVAQNKGNVEIGAVWNDAGSDGHDSDNDDALRAGRMLIDLTHQPLPLAVAAPGVN